MASILVLIAATFEAVVGCMAKRRKPPVSPALPAVTNSSKPTLMFLATLELSTVLMASTSACPCVMPPGHCWLCRDQLDVLSRIKRTFGLAAVPAEAPVKISISSAMLHMGVSRVEKHTKSANPLDLNVHILVSPDSCRIYGQLVAI